jgi:hypothetical protein
MKKEGTWLPFTSFTVGVFIITYGVEGRGI